MAIDRGLLRAGAVVAGIVLLLVGAIAALGGFRPALVRGPAVAAGEPVALQRWTIVVERAGYVDTSLAGLETDPAVRVGLRITNTTDETITGLPERLVSVQVKGVELAPGEPSWGQPRSATFDPEVEIALAYDFAWSAVPAPSGEIDVLVRDESLRKNFLIADHWTPTTPAATVRLPCPDGRQRR